MTSRSSFARVLVVLGMLASSLLATLLWAEPPAEGLGTTLRTPVTRPEVWQAVAAELRVRGVKDEELPLVEQIGLPVAVPALAGRKLRVLSLCRDEGAGRTQFRLGCSAAGQCLPFLVYLNDVSVGNADLNHADLDHANLNKADLIKADRGNSYPESRAAAGVVAASCREPSPRASLTVASKPAIRAGDRATAVYVADRLRMSASVICLERGREGEVIRVRSQDGHIFRARVSGPAQLEAVPQ